jgi:hypothetical protein
VGNAHHAGTAAILKSRQPCGAFGWRSLILVGRCRSRRDITQQRSARLLAKPAFGAVIRPAVVVVQNEQRRRLNARRRPQLQWLTKKENNAKRFGIRAVPIGFHKAAPDPAAEILF